MGSREGEVPGGGKGLHDPDDPADPAEPGGGLSRLLRPEILVYEGPTGAGGAGPGQPYQVVEGDNLWDIADRYLGDPFRWPEIFESSTGLTQPFGRQMFPQIDV